MGTSILTLQAGSTRSDGGDGAVPIPTDGLVLWLDANETASYPGTGIYWNDLSGQNNLFKLLQPSAFQTSANGNWMAFHDTASCAYKDSGLIGPDAEGTVVFIGRINSNNADWRTSFTGQLGDPNLKWYGLVEVGSNYAGVYDLATDAFYNSNYDITSIPDISTKFHTWVFKLGTSSPYWRLAIDGATTLASLTNPATSFTTGFYSIGALNVGYPNPQPWGDIGAFIYYDRFLTDPEIEQINTYYQNIYNPATTSTSSSSSTTEEPTTSTSSTTEEPTTSTPAPTTSTTSTSPNPSVISGLSLWLDGADNTTTFQDVAGTVPATSNGDIVALWKDKSGNVADASQSNSGSEPTLATASLNGLNSLAFSTDYLLGVFASTVNMENTTYIVFKNNTASNNQTFLDLRKTASGSANEDLWYISSGLVGTGYELVARSHANVLNYTTDGGPDTNWHYLIAAYDNTSLQLTVNGFTPVSTNQAFGTTDLNNYDIGRINGGGLNLDGNIAEIIIYNRYLNSGENSTVVTYLQNKWNLS